MKKKTSHQKKKKHLRFSICKTIVRFFKSDKNSFLHFQNDLTGYCRAIDQFFFVFLNDLKIFWIFFCFAINFDRLHFFAVITLKMFFYHPRIFFKITWSLFPVLIYSSIFHQIFFFVPILIKKTFLFLKFQLKKSNPKSAPKLEFTCSSIFSLSFLKKKKLLSSLDKKKE